MLTKTSRANGVIITVQREQMLTTFIEAIPFQLFRDILFLDKDGSVNRPGGRFLLRLETTPIVVELRPEHGVLLLKTGNILLQQLNVLAFDEKQSATNNRYGSQHDQRQTQAKECLVPKTQHSISLLCPSSQTTV